VRLDGENASAGAVTLGPESDRVWGLVDALSVIVTPPVEPVTNGTNVTVMVHVAPTASVVTQLSVSVKLPLATTLEMTRSAVPLLVSVTDWGTLEFAVVKVRTAGASVTAGPETGAVVVVVVDVGPVDDPPPHAELRTKSRPASAMGRPPGRPLRMAAGAVEGRRANIKNNSRSCMFIIREAGFIMADGRWLRLMATPIILIQRGPRGGGVL